MRKLLLVNASILTGATLPSAPPAFAQGICGNTALTVINATVRCTTNGNLSATGTAVDVGTGATLDITVRATDTVKSTSTGYGIKSIGTTTITNYGTITGMSPNAYTSGATVEVFAGTTTITNQGIINGGANNTVSLDVSQSGTVILTNSGEMSSGITFSNTTETANVITNHGLISAHGTPISLSGQSSVTINQYGRIHSDGNGTAAIRIMNPGPKITLNLYNGSVFEAAYGLAMSSKTDTGSTINFYAPNYSLVVQNFLYGQGKNTVTLQSPGSILTFTGNDTANGNGMLVVSTPAPGPSSSTPSVAQATATAVQSALQMTTPRNYVPPLQNTLPDVGWFSGVQGGAASAPGGGAGMSNLGMNLRGTETDDTLSGNGQSIDRHGNLVWARAFGAAHFQPTNDGIAGSINRTSGVLLGYDRQFTTWRLGAYGGYGLNNAVVTNGSAKLQTQLYLAGLYGQTKLAATSFTFNLGGGILGNSSTRYMNNAAEVASADFRGAFFAPDAALAYDIAVARGWTLTPALRVRYIATATDAYAETGSTQNIAYGSAFTSSFEERAELRLSHKQTMANGGTFGSYLQAAAIATQRIGAGAVSASILGTEMSVQSATAGTVTGLSLGAGLDAELSKDIFTYAGIDATEFSDAAKAITGRIGVRIAF